MWILLLLILSGPDKGLIVPYKSADEAVMQFRTGPDCAAKLAAIAPVITKEAGDTGFALVCQKPPGKEV